ncbi:MAG: VOC family protein [Streptosporangiaceae bacterium]
MPRLTGESHNVLVVRDLERSMEWYCRVFGFIVVRDQVSAVGLSFTSLLHPESHAFIGLGQPDSPDGTSFDDRAIGLQHLGYHVPERSDLEEWTAHLNALGISHMGVQHANYGSFVFFRDPDNILLEVYWPNRRFFAKLLLRATRPHRRSRSGTST